MTSKIIEYDLKKPGRNYDAVYEIIKSKGINLVDDIFNEIENK